jgi:hypothetical protein
VGKGYTNLFVTRKDVSCPRLCTNFENGSKPSIQGPATPRDEREGRRGVQVRKKLPTLEWYKDMLSYHRCCLIEWRSFEISGMVQAEKKY